MVTIRGRLAPEVGAVLVQALAAAREALYQGDVSAEPPTMAQQQADALALVAETALHHGIDPGAPGERYQVVVHVDAPALADPDQPGQSVLADGTHVSAETSRRLACDASRVVMRHGLDDRVVEVAARTRTIPPALRRAPPPRPRLPVPRLRAPVRPGPSHPSLGPRGPHHALESRLALSPPPPRGSRGRLPARSPARRRASVPPPGRPASARGAHSSGSSRRSRQDPTSTARCRGACPERADHYPGVAGGAPGRGLGNRRLASLGALGSLMVALPWGRLLGHGAT